MTYGVYTRDLTGVSISELDLETAKGYCRQDHVVCSEKYNTTSFVLHLRVTKYWEFKLRPRWNYLSLGFIHISWETTRQLWADKIVYDPQAKEGETK